MLINFKNKELVPIATFLGNVKLAGTASRGRTKLIKLLAAKNIEYSEDRRDALSLFFDGDTLIPEKEAEARAAANEVESETASITTDEYTDKLIALRDGLTKYSEPFKGENALIYDLILDQLDKLEEKGHDN